MADFPSVPAVPGVPALLREAGAVIPTAVALLTGDTVVRYGIGSTPAWGIYQNGEPVILADTVVNFGYKQEWAVADYQIERGGFSSYDKVDLPFDARVRLVAGGPEEARQALLGSVQAIAGDLNLYDVVTPEKVYTSVNITHQEYQRSTRSGVGLIAVDVWLLEIRINGQTSNQNTKSASGASPVNGGFVQPTDATPAELSFVDSLTPTDL